MSTDAGNAGRPADGARRAETITLEGHVQGVGFRPFVFALAGRHRISGHVRNCLGEVEILACGHAADLEAFAHELIASAPPLAKPSIVSREPAAAPAEDGFDIVASSSSHDARIFIPPDYFMCDDCRRELNDPADRRYRYPFINCTQCGPRYTLIRSLPYDRPNTSMADFPLCEACEGEYTNPLDRRFHAEPVACPDCGPSVTFESRDTGAALHGAAALDSALDVLRSGGVLAVKGIGGYHLLCDAGSEDAVARMRDRKRRPDKPLAVMFPVAGEDGLALVRDAVQLDTVTAERLASPERPIVLVPKRRDAAVAWNVAPGLDELGVFLPYSPLHELLLASFSAPLVATSGNISGEPVLIDNGEAAARLEPVADAFLHHDRPIVRPADDSVYRRIAGRTRPLRIGRGAAPAELELPLEVAEPTLAVGGHMKGTVALAWGRRAVVSPHIGEMDSPKSLAVFEQIAADLQSLYGVSATRIVCDAHPGYTTHRWARRQDLPVETVWHHRAHASAIAAEQARPGRWLVFAWDGVGLGEDGTLWGGDALLGAPGSWTRVASFKPFRLPGGDRAGREPWRSAAALSWETGRQYAPAADPDGIAEAAWARRINSPVTTAAGRLFDAAAAMILGIDHVSFEAQGPMLLESCCRQAGEAIGMPLEKNADGTWQSDWEPLLDTLGDNRLAVTARAGILHASMARAALDQARRIRDSQPFDRVGLAGGVFQNRVLTERVVTLLEADGIDVFVPERLPSNDAAISFGQLAELAARDALEK